MTDISQKIGRLTRERDDYRAQVDRLDRKVFRLQEEWSRISCEAGRCRTVATLVHDLYDALHPQITVNESGPLFLRLLTGTLHIERAVLLTRLPEENCFIVRHASGFHATADSLSLNGKHIKELTSAKSQDGSNPFIAELQKFLGVPFLLWSYQKNEEMALLLGNSVEDHHCPFEQGDQEVIESIFNVFIEIIIRKRTEKELRLAAEVFAGSVEGIIITDADFQVLRVNRAFTGITEYQEDEVVGRKLSWLKDAAFEQVVTDSLKEQDNWRGEYRNTTKNGAEYVSWLNISTVKNARGKVTDYIVAFLDITKEKYREAENARYAQDLTPLLANPFGRRYDTHIILGTCPALETT
ncbi:MAG: PAS domain-containing protein, partial [Candidatus Electrothrix sp. AR4]|nr:PAS domain-containing protein [Candidatus Electrothrix sp. AR4]